MTEYIIFILTFAASATAPRPEIAGILSRALSRGMTSSWSLSLGIILGKLLMLTATIVGLTALVGVLGPMFVVLKFCGATYLIWLGIKKWRNAGRVLPEGEKAKSIHFMAEVGLGLAMALSNPIAIVFYMALLPGVVDISHVTLNSYLILCSIIIGVMFMIVISYGIMAEVARKLFSSSNSKKYIDRIAGAMMVGTALWIVTR